MWCRVYFFRGVQLQYYILSYHVGFHWNEKSGLTIANNLSSWSSYIIICVWQLVGKARCKIFHFERFSSTSSLTHFWVVESTQARINTRTRTRSSLRICKLLWDDVTIRFSWVFESTHTQLLGHIGSHSVIAYLLLLVTFWPMCQGCTVPVCRLLSWHLCRRLLRLLR